MSPIETYPANSPFDTGPGSNVFASIKIPDVDEVAGFFNRTLGNYKNAPMATGIYEYWQKVAPGELPLYYVGSAPLRTLFQRLDDHVNKKTDDHPLSAKGNVIWTVLDKDIRGTVLVSKRSIFAAEQIRKQQLIRLGIPLANDSESFPVESIKWWWEQGFYKNVKDWPDWLYPPDDLLK